MRQFIPFAIPSGSPSTVQTQTKSATITTNGGSVTVQPDSGYLLSSATVSANIPTQTKNATITTNGGSKTVTPDSGKLLTSVKVSANIPTEVKTQTITANGSYTITPASGKLMTKATVSVNVPSGLLPFIAEYDYQTYTPNGNVTDNVTFSFSQMTAAPDLILITAGMSNKTENYQFGGGVYFHKPFGMLQPLSDFFTGYTYSGRSNTSAGWVCTTSTDTTGVINATKDGFTFVQSTYGSGKIRWESGWTYHIIAIRLKVPT